MTISDFATKHTISERTVRVWIEKGYIPGASLAEDYVPASARKPYTKARAKPAMPFIAALSMRPEITFMCCRPCTACVRTSSTDMLIAWLKLAT